MVGIPYLLGWERFPASLHPISKKIQEAKGQGFGMVQGSICTDETFLSYCSIAVLTYHDQGNL